MTETLESRSARAEVDFIMPVYNEGANIGRALAEIDAHVATSKRVLIVYDFDEDNTLSAVRALMPLYPGVELVKNTLGKGVLNAIRAGIAATTADVVIITMADLSDDLTVVPKMVSLIRNQGYDVVCASRYMRGGHQIGGPWFKGLLSRAAGLSLHWIAGLPTHDATNAFRAYRREVLLETEIESKGGFEYSLEITAKAHASGRLVTETPSTWRDRSAGQSRFRLLEWLPQYLRWYGWTINQSRRADVLAVSLLLLIGLAFGIGRIALRPDLLFSVDYVYGETGNALYRSARLIDGAWLYRDVACQYGPIPVYAHAAFAASFGNTILCNQAFHLICSLACLGVTYAVLRRGLGIGLSLVICLVAGLPLILVSGGVTGGYTNVEYISWERMSLLVLMLCWQPPGRRTASSSAVLGLALGLWQVMKFGGAAFGIIALMGVDAISMNDGRPRQTSSTIRSWGIILGVFALVEAIWAGTAFVLIPQAIAKETLWPAYMVRSYDYLYIGRFPGWSGLRYFVGKQLLLVDFSLIGFAMLGLQLWRKFTRRGPLPSGTGANHCLAIGNIFLVVSAPFYLKHEHHFYQYGWLLIFSAGWGISRMRALWQTLAIFVATPSLLLMTLITFVNRPAADLVHSRLRSGEVLFLQPAVAREIEMLSLLSTAGIKAKDNFTIVMFNWGGGGYYHYYNNYFPMRNYMIEPVSFRSYDADQLSFYLPRVANIVIRSENTSRDRIESKIRATFPILLASRILKEYEFNLTRSVGLNIVLTRKAGLAAHQTKIE